MDIESFYNQYYAADQIPEDDPCSDDYYQTVMEVFADFDTKK